MNDFKKIEVKLDEEMVSRLQELSEILNVSVNKIINTSLLDGILPYWLPYQQTLTEISDKENPITEEDYQDAIDALAAKINSDFEILKLFDSRESEFESLYPIGHFKDLEERKTKFIKFLKTNIAIELEEPEEEIDTPTQEKAVDIPIDNDITEEEEDVFPSLFSRFFSYINDQVKSKVTNYSDMISHGRFLGILAFINFSIFYFLYLTWPSLFDFVFMLENFPLWQSLLSMVSILILIPIMCIITGFIVGKIYYYLIKKKRFIRSVKYILFPLGVQMYLGKKITIYFVSKRKKGEKYHNYNK